MPYTIACHHHADGHRGRDPRQWGTWQEAAQAICDHVEAMARRASPPLEGEEVRYVLRIAAQAADTGIAVLPGLVEVAALTRGAGAQPHDWSTEHDGKP